MLAKCLAVVFLSALAVAEMPSFVTVCGRRNPNVNKCVRDSMDELRDRLKGGIPELNLPPQDPLYFDGFSISNTDTLKATAHNVTIRGLGNFQTKSIEVDFKAQQFHSVTFYPKIIVDAEYDLDSKILIPISGQGPIHIETDEVLVDMVMKYKLLKKNGLDYMYFVSITSSLTLKNWTAVFEPTASMDSTLISAINTALESGREEISETYKPNIEKVIAELTLERANKVAQIFTYDEIFPDTE